MTNFFNKQNDIYKKSYIELLEITGSLSNLFSESSNPFIYYRAMENIFCKAFNADNLSRSDVSADAGKDGIGIGLKTFLHNNGNTYQKIAEFNRESYLLKELDNEEIIKKVSIMRNERIEATKRICGLNDMIYHLLTRSLGEMSIYEEHMDLIDIENIKILKVNKTTIHFIDGLNEYSFNLSKSTLLKRFKTLDGNALLKFKVEILEDPFEFLLNKKHETFKKYDFDKKNQEVMDYIVLPLYSPKDGKVQVRSGLNQWNAKGRLRNSDEVYIVIPSWIHKKKNGFFSYNTVDKKTESFDVILPNKKILSMRVAQSGGKALMSDPNKALGEWILRDVLKLKEKTLVTKEILDTVGIDSVKLSKLKGNRYALDFLKLGSYEDFYEKYNN